MCVQWIAQEGYNLYNFFHKSLMFRLLSWSTNFETNQFMIDMFDKSIKLQVILLAFPNL